MLHVIHSFLAAAAFRTHDALAIGVAPIKPPSKIGIGTGTGGARAMNLACLGLRWIFTAAIVFSIIMALLAAIEYMRSAGDPAKVKASTNRLIFTAIGIAVAILARSLPVIVGSFLDVSGGTASGSLCQ